MNERQATAAKWATESLLSSLRVDILNPQHLETAKEHLKHGSVIAYIDHFSYFDFATFGQVVRRIGPLEDLTVMVSKKFFDQDRDIVNRGIGKALRTWGELYGVSYIPVVQQKELSLYPNSAEINRAALDEARKVLQTQGEILGAAPEGTKSKKGHLIEAERGFELLLRRGGENVLALPLAGFHRTVLPGTTTTIAAGEPFTLADIRAEQQLKPGKTITDLAMLRLASLLPEKNRGPYGNLV